MTQKQLILDYLKKNNSITSWKAIQDFHNIETQKITNKNSRTGKITQYAKYVYHEPTVVGDNYSLALV